MSDTGRAERWLSVAEMLDVYSAPTLFGAVRLALEDSGDLRIDLGGSPTIHGAALQILLAAAHAAGATGRTVTFEGVSDELAATWRLTGLDTAVAIAGAPEEGATA